MATLIRPMIPADWALVKAIYEQGIATGLATFELAAPSWDEWNGAHHAEPRMVATRDDAVAGWAALAPVSRRRVYAGVAEVSVYVDADARRSGVGRDLLSALIEASEHAGFWTLQAGIFPDNEASVRLHQRHGFRVVGIREKIAARDGQWRDVLLLERRSRTVGLPDRGEGGAKTRPVS